ncbi:MULTISPECIES: type II toxin-antitoxin system RelE/ParE family toxin [Rhizobium]|uniref:type II toxin-antitoxin system RelE/ParE family toxin n=1 Tax=Rhizobium sp. WYCCWR10014 TaxID=1825933 RepID=UPI0012E90055|nr:MULTISPECIES: type II toxin-antitoxin system RelE/ParE family toxin [Rhizobium]
MELTWSAFALLDRDATFTYIEAENPQPPSRRTDHGCRPSVDRFPASGRVGRIDGTRELAIYGTPYVAAYAISKTTVRILRVLDGAQEWPDTLPTS